MTILALVATVFVVGGVIFAIIKILKDWDSVKAWLSGVSPATVGKKAKGAGKHLAWSPAYIVGFALWCVAAVAAIWIAILVLRWLTETVAEDSPIAWRKEKKEEVVVYIPPPLVVIEEEMEKKGTWVPWDGELTIETKGEEWWHLGIIVPPQTPYRRHSVYGMKQESYLLTGGDFPKVPSLEEVRVKTWNGRDERVYVYRLDDEPGEWPLHQTFSNDMDTPLIHYFMCPTAARFRISHPEHEGVQQWFVNLKHEEAASFVVPQGLWRFLWICPIRDPEHLARLAYDDESPIPPEGVDLSNLEPDTVAKAAYLARVRATRPFSNIGYQGMYIQFDDNPPTPLTENKSWECVVGGIEGRRITLGLNVNNGPRVPEVPAKVLVGISL